MMRVGIEKLIRDSFRIQHTTQIMKVNNLPLKNALGLGLKEDSFLKTEETEGGLYSFNRKSLRTKAVPDSIIDIINFHPFDSENYEERRPQLMGGCSTMTALIGRMHGLCSRGMSHTFGMRGIKLCCLL